jgi:hypothetical protein
MGPQRWETARTGMADPRFSEDGRWWWDGTRWLPAISEDGQWRWDGSRWVSRHPAGMPGTGPASVGPGRIVALIAIPATLLIAGVGTLVIVSSHGRTAPTAGTAGIALVTPDSIAGERHIMPESDGKLRADLSQFLGSAQQVIAAQYGQQPGTPDHLVLAATGPIEHGFNLYLENHYFDIDQASRAELTRGSLLLECYNYGPQGGSLCIWGEPHFMGAAFDLRHNDLNRTADFTAAAHQSVRSR